MALTKNLSMIRGDAFAFQLTLVGENIGLF